eukprot:TRINITY_DN21997_c0_g2_i1.p1 TRINITY_DN21997_c0_g2~~TRINITY_DN21997_c0_g2_i1.p1  ORF type:complete len:577 (+),score=95.09 TRINITY_DN21997_c0_g2_i1:120-1850(+)
MDESSSAICTSCAVLVTVGIVTTTVAMLLALQARRWSGGPWKIGGVLVKRKPTLQSDAGVKPPPPREGDDGPVRLDLKDGQGVLLEEGLMKHDRFEAWAMRPQLASPCSKAVQQPSVARAEFRPPLVTVEGYATKLRQQAAAAVAVAAEGDSRGASPSTTTGVSSELFSPTRRAPRPPSARVFVDSGRPLSATSSSRGRQSVFQSSTRDSNDFGAGIDLEHGTVFRGDGSNLDPPLYGQEIAARRLNTVSDWEMSNIHGSDLYRRGVNDVWLPPSHESKSRFRVFRVNSPESRSSSISSESPSAWRDQVSIWRAHRKEQKRLSFERLRARKRRSTDASDLIASDFDFDEGGLSDGSTAVHDVGLACNEGDARPAVNVDNDSTFSCQFPDPPPPPGYELPRSRNASMSGVRFVAVGAAAGHSGRSGGDAWEGGSRGRGSVPWRKDEVAEDVFPPPRERPMPPVTLPPTTAPIFNSSLPSRRLFCWVPPWLRRSGRSKESSVVTSETPPDPAVHACTLIAAMQGELEATRCHSLEARRRTFRELQRRLHPDKNVQFEEAAKLAFQALMCERRTYLADT